MDTVNVTQQEHDALVAAASGSTSLPLSAQDAKWDAGAARKTLKPAQFAKAHFWRDPEGDPDLIGSYKLPFAEVIDGTLTAIWHGITAGAARLSQTDIPAVDKKAVQGKMGAYYAKAAKQFKDDSIVAPWDDAKASSDAVRLAALRELAPGLQSLTDSEILGTHALILAAMKKHDYRGDGEACAVCGEMASADCHYEAKTEKLALDVVEMTVTAAADGGPTAWQATLLVEGVATEDGRLIAEGATTWRALPLPLGLMLETPHSDIVEAPVCGRIDDISRAGSLIQARGIFNDTADDAELRATGLQAVEAVRDRIVKGVSVDLLVLADDVIFVPDEEDDNDASGDQAGQDGMDIADDLYPVEADQPVAVIEMPEGRYIYVVTEGVIGSACVVPVPAIAQGQIQVITADLSHVFEKIRFVTLFVEESLVAAVAPLRPPADWFDDPQLDRPTPLTITDDGRVYGHVALWSSCHQGFPGRCVPPPHSRSGYSLFHVGAIKTAEGDTIAIGKITLKAPHADVALNSEAARAHYDNTGTVAAFVRAGEDQYGPWVAGALRSDAPEEIVRDLLANPLSGDWRAGEMIAAHAVPAPGFPVLRAAAFDDEGEETETALIMTSPIPLEGVEEEPPMSPLAYLRPGRTRAA